MDETRYPREDTNGNWVWGAVSPKVAVLSLLSSRARYVIDSLIGQSRKASSSPTATPATRKLRLSNGS